jgi:hypothetical protein
MKDTSVTYSTITQAAAAAGNTNSSEAYTKAIVSAAISLMA